MSKLQTHNHPLQKMSRHLNAHKLKLYLNNSQKMPPSLSSSKKAKPAQSSKPKMIPHLHSKPMTIPLLHCNHKMNPFLNKNNNTLRIHLHLYPAKTVTVHFQIMAQNSNCLQQKIPIPYQRNRDTVYIQNLIRFNQFCLIFSLQITKEIHEPHSKNFLPKFSIFSNILTQMSFAFSFQYQSDAFIIFFFSARILFHTNLNLVYVLVLVSSCLSSSIV